MGADAVALALDITLAVTVIALGWRAVLTTERFEAVGLFIGLGLVMAIAILTFSLLDIVPVVRKRVGNLG